MPLRPYSLSSHSVTRHGRLSACKGNPGPGGWGVLMMSGATEKEMFGGELGTTNNRMEMMAVIQGLEALTRPCQVTLYLDSQYVLKGITEWLP
ncbi:MAG: RNase H family protein, partial [Burkholderiaceae bacterium]|nr:RNase H family protein [Burkholderiaceae bacterium]